MLKFVKRSRLILTSTIATVTPQQMKFMNKMSQLVVKSSSSSQSDDDDKGVNNYEVRLNETGMRKYVT